MQSSLAALDMHTGTTSGFSADNSNIMYSYYGQEHSAPSDELEDEEVYGAPSDDEPDTHAPCARTPQKIHSSQRSYKIEDDIPLGSHASLDIRAAHERIIRQEKQAQSDKTLKILEGKLTPRQSHGPRRSHTMPHRRQREPPSAFESVSNPTTSHPSAADIYADSTKRHHPLQRSATTVKKKESHWKLTDSHTTSVNQRDPKALADKTALEAQMRDVTMAMAHMPPLGASSSSHSTVPPLRVFFHNVQKYVMVPMVEHAVVMTVLHQALTLNGLAPRTNTFDGWALFDVIPECGLERPLREYERIDDIVHARGQRSSGYFLLKLYDRPDLLRADSIPPFSSVLGGSIFIRLDGGKWYKKWLELREHSLFIAKDEKVRSFTYTQSKPESRICTMMEWDLYLVDTQKVSQPKAFGFALRHQSSQAPAIYICQSDPAAHSDWVSAILRARSYVLKQERPELFMVARNIERAEHHAAHVRRAQSVRRNAELQRSKMAKAARGAMPSSQAPTLIPSASLEAPFEKGSLLYSIGRPKS